VTRPLNDARHGGLRGPQGFSAENRDDRDARLADGALIFVDRGQQ
jgi:hypothetical protein